MITQPTRLTTIARVQTTYESTNIARLKPQLSAIAQHSSARLQQLRPES